VVQQDICNGCGYCIPACPYGVIDRREEDGRAHKCTLCYDRLKDDMEPACAHACPTKSIQFGELSELRERAEKRVEKLIIRDLEPLERERFSKQWVSVQSRFVDSPKGAVAEADDLVSSLMTTRGYPVSDFDQRAADISVDHPRVVENYRSAHEIALRVGKDAATTEDLRTAMIHYRSLFEELVQAPTIVERKQVA